MINNYLAQINKHQRDDNISFKEEGHIYTVNGNNDYKSVTTWIHEFSEPFDSNKIIKKMMNSTNWPNNKYFGKTIDEIKSIWELNRLITSSAGTKLHYDIECKYNNIDVSNSTTEYNYFINFMNDYKHLIPFRTEMLVYHEEAKLSGSIDMIFKKSNGAYEIYDWKRSKEIKKTNNFNKWLLNPIIDHLPDTNYWHYSLQLNIYKYILINKYDMMVDDLFLVVLHPDNDNYIRIPVTNLQNEVKQLFHYRIENLFKY